MRYLDDLSPVYRFLDLKAQRAAIDAELDALRPLLTAALMEEDGETYQCRGHRFTVQRRRSWAYSDRVSEAERDLKAMKRREERDGTAEIVRHVAYPMVTRTTFECNIEEVPT